MRGLNLLGLMMTGLLAGANAQHLDPTRDATGVVLESAMHTPAPEEYIWTASEAGNKTDQGLEKHYFRHTFDVAAAPAQATLYVAGPRWAKVYLNGAEVDEVTADPSSPLGMHVFMTDVSQALKAGRNVIAIEAVRSRVNRDKWMVVKIVPAAFGVDAKALMMSDASWKSSLEATAGWEQTGFHEDGWKAVKSFGGIESSNENYQWNADAGLYDWPGYDGISPYLAHMKVPVAKVVWVNEGRNKFAGADALLRDGGLSLKLAGGHEDEGASSMLLDFGKELTGRVELVSDADVPETVSIQYGESSWEAEKSPFLGVDVLTLAAHATGHGPKSAFRYALIRFLSGGSELKFKSIHVDDIFYPVKYVGSFESSDAELNKIWETGAYTVHLCMQDGLWDAPKRDRGRWMGDDDVSGRTVNNVFGDHFLLEDTIERLIGPVPVKEDVNGIPGYSSYWFTGTAEYYKHTGSKAFLEKTHQQAIELLQFIDSQFDERNLYVNKRKAWLYVDWSPEMNGDTPETRRASEFEFYRAYRDGAWMLKELGDTKNADFYEKRAAAIKVAADQYLLDKTTGTYGPRWQTNAMAVLSGIATPDQYDAIWKGVLSQVGHVKYNAFMISPYYNYYVISAMAKMGHQADALDWIKQYWGGMIKEGATSFWEAYDTSWSKAGGDFHAALQSDDGTGYFVSLSHGWSSGPTAWLMEEMLGIHATGAGFSTVEIAPDLLGLDWAKGAEPTPKGLLKVDVKKGTITVDVPEGVEATVVAPKAWGGKGIRVNGKAGDSARSVVLKTAGHYVVEGRQVPGTGNF